MKYGYKVTFSPVTKKSDIRDKLSYSRNFPLYRALRNVPPHIQRTHTSADAMPCAAGSRCACVLDHSPVAGFTKHLCRICGMPDVSYHLPKTKLAWMSNHGSRESQSKRKRVCETFSEMERMQERVLLGEHRWGGRRSAYFSALVIAPALWRIFFFLVVSRKGIHASATFVQHVWSAGFRGGGAQVYTERSKLEHAALIFVFGGYMLITQIKRYTERTRCTGISAAWRHGS